MAQAFEPRGDRAGVSAETTLSKTTEPARSPAELTNEVGQRIAWARGVLQVLQADVDLNDGTLHAAAAGDAHLADADRFLGDLFNAIPRSSKTCELRGVSRETPDQPLQDVIEAMHRENWTVSSATLADGNEVYVVSQILTEKGLRKMLDDVTRAGEMLEQLDKLA